MGRKEDEEQAVIDLAANHMHLIKEYNKIKEALERTPICKCSGWAVHGEINIYDKTNNHHPRCESFKMIKKWSE